MYQVLYRKWRPQVFEDVIGQPHITKTLLNELKAERIAHAYLFTGSHGIGKTTCAKILSKAVNCLNPKGGDPCNECVNCKGIDNGSILDVSEIDAASNRGVDNIRELREETNFTPAQAKYRVYIIDEVHMLTMEAFNALLKTLEEPPPYVIFILATTEVHKLPATILSRCQRFDFRRISPTDIGERLLYFAQKEELNLEKEAALLIARIADGSMRDALSLLDQVAGMSSEITTDFVRQAAGLAGREHLFKLSDAIASENTAKALDSIDELHTHSLDMEQLCNELIEQFRNYMLIKTMKNVREIILTTDEELAHMKEQSDKFTLERIISILDILQESLETMRYGTQKRVRMEMTLVRLTTPTMNVDMPAISARLTALESAVKAGGAGKMVQHKETVDTEVKKDVKPPWDEPKEKPKPETEPKPEPEKKTVVQEKTQTRAGEGDEIPLPEAPPWGDEPVVEPKEQKTKQKKRDDNEILKTSKEATPEQEIKEKPIKKQPKPAEDEKTDETVDDETDLQENPFMEWPEVLQALFQYNKPLRGILAGSKAFKRGENRILIQSPNPALADLLRRDNHIGSLNHAVLEVTGREHRLGVYRHEESSEKKKKTKDPLDDLLGRAGSADIEIEIQ